jgi:CRP-like cAMP-binding protein
MALFDNIPTSTKDFEAILQCIENFSRISDSRFENELFSTIKTFVYHRPTILQYENKLSDKSYFVAKGFVFAFFYDENQEIVAFRIFTKGEVALIPDSFMNLRIAGCSLMVCSDSRLLEITHADALYLYETFPEIVMVTVQMLAEMNMKDVDRDKMLSLGKKGSISRFYELYPELYGNTTHQFRDMYIARYLHMNPVTFSRLRRELFPNYPDE